MADALCGPSNALSNFQKHSSVDRTLQQDRLASQRSHEQGFRSAPGPNAGILDAEFEAFQAGQLPQLHDAPPEHHFHNAFPPHNFAQSHQPPQAQLPGWASEFQNMSLNDVHQSSAAASQFRGLAPVQPSSSSSWQQDFMQQSATDYPQGRIAPYGTDPGRLAFSPLGYMPAQDANMPQRAYNQSMEPAQSQEVDDAFFEKHFEAAALEATQTMGQAEIDTTPLNGTVFANDAQHHDESFDSASLLGPSIQRDYHPEPVIDASPQDPIGSDLILEEEDNRRSQKGKQPEGTDEADELARTAGTLLENVQHDRSQKFQQSSFLSLMRQLRDREVRVEGDKLVDATQALHPGGEFYPGQHEQERPAAAADLPSSTAGIPGPQMTE